MSNPGGDLSDHACLVPALPGWVTGLADEPLETAAFRSGAALASLALAAAQPAVPQALWRDRLALAAAERCAVLAGRPERMAEMRDALHLTRPGDSPGPGGTILAQWSRAVARPISAGHLAGAVAGPGEDRIARCLDAPGTNPVDRAAAAIEAVLGADVRAEVAALILADAVLSRSLGGAHLRPVLALGLRPRDLRLRADALRLACHRAAAAGVGRALPLAAELARAAARLRAVVPRLRARGAARAAELFLSRDALAPSALDFMSDRAARRLCDRLVALGAVRELTGRETFRLYGL
ncbi:MAG: DUF1403 family protein [Gemmobacter sp.]